MKTITLLQIGDVHFDQASAGPDVDVKDQQISPALIREMAPSRLRAVMQAIQKRCEAKPPTAAVFCGDLTSRGDLPIYINCVSYLDRALGLSHERFWSEDDVHVVPGNHDVDRRNADPEGKDLFKKFLPLESAWRDQSLDVLACMEVRPTKMRGEMGGELTVYSINSCIGCGEKRARQGVFTEAQRKDLERRKQEGNDEAADALWEGLDTPLFAKEHLTDLNSAISEMPPTQLPVVLAHHNLLPQAVPRADIYTELINGGAARTRLASHERWVLYLHGHIHDDPIEVIEQRYPGSGRVLCISAPVLEDGFNVITIEFGYADRPMGAAIGRYRYEKGGDVRLRGEVRVGLAARADEPSQLQASILSVLKPGTNVRFRELEQALKQKLAEMPEREDLCDALREAEWADYITISEREDEPSQWTISRGAL